LLVEGDGTPGSEETTTTTRAAASGSSAADDSRLIWMIVAALSGLAILVAVLTWRYWLLTRPGLDVDDDADDGEGGGGPPGYDPRDPRQAGVDPPGWDDPYGGPGGPTQVGGLGMGAPPG